MNVGHKKSARLSGADAATGGVSTLRECSLRGWCPQSQGGGAHHAASRVACRCAASHVSTSPRRYITRPRMRSHGGPTQSRRQRSSVATLRCSCAATSAAARMSSCRSPIAHYPGNAGPRWIAAARLRAQASAGYVSTATQPGYVAVLPCRNIRWMVRGVLPKSIATLVVAFRQPPFLRRACAARIFSFRSFAASPR